MPDAPQDRTPHADPSLVIEDQEESHDRTVLVSRGEVVSPAEITSKDTH